MLTAFRPDLPSWRRAARARLPPASAAPLRRARHRAMRPPSRTQKAVRLDSSLYPNRGASIGEQRNHLGETPMRKLLLTISFAFAAAPVAADVISVAPRDVDGLVAAIEQANRSPGEDIIELAPGSLYAL